jgi:alkylated DNA repair dioxygenase AlkB
MEQTLSQKNLLPFDGEVIYLPNYFQKSYLNELTESLNWICPEITLFGKTHPTPRLISWVADEGKIIRYSGMSFQPNEWSEELLYIRNKIEEFDGEYNGVLANLYRQGSDYMGEHSDNEKELGMNPIIASASFGETRKMYFKHKESKQRVDIELEDKSLLIMKGRTQDFWNHGIPKQKKIHFPRINLTFRKIV